MKFVNNAKYISDQTKIAELRPKHRDYLAGLMKEGKVAAAGPYADGSGTLIIYASKTSKRPTRSSRPIRSPPAAYSSAAKSSPGRSSSANRIC